MVSAAFNDIDFGPSYTQHGSSLRMDALCLVAAIVLHVPLYFIKLDASKKTTDRPTSRLVAVDLIEPELPKPVEVAPPPPVKEESKFMEKLKALMKKEPPPPPAPVPEVKQPDKLLDVPKPIELQQKLANLPQVQPKLESKAGFQTKVDPNLVKDQNLALNKPAGGIAPLSAKKLGTVDDRSTLKNNKGNFQVGQKEQLSGIGDGPGLAGAAPAPVVALRTGKAGSTEKFSAPATQKADKGKLGAVPGGSLNSPQLGLRDAIIARDAAPTQIGGSKPGMPGGVTGGVPGGVGTKKDAGSFQSSNSGSLGSAGLPAAGTVDKAPAIAQITKKKEKKSLFVITGPLQNRDIEKQVPPEYPAWAQAQGIEAAVVVEFTVDAMGIVKPNMVVRKTSGYPKLDETAMKALRQWKFVPLAGGENVEQVGMITFNYSLD